MIMIIIIIIIIAHITISSILTISVGIGSSVLELVIITTRVEVLNPIEIGHLFVELFFQLVVHSTFAGCLLKIFYQLLLGTHLWFGSFLFGIVFRVWSCGGLMTIFFFIILINSKRNEFSCAK